MSRPKFVNAAIVAAGLFTAPAFADDAAICKDGRALPDAKIEACGRLIESAKPKGKDMAVVRNSRGDAYFSNKEYDRAIADYDEAIRLDPGYARAFSNRGWAYLRKRDYDRVIADCDEALRLNPKLAPALAIRGSAYREKGDYDRAIRDISQAIGIEPRASWAFRDRGIAYREQGDYDHAFADFDQAIRIDPKFADAFVNRGYIWNDKKNYDRAIADYDLAIQADPRYGSAFRNRAEAYRRKGDYEHAITDINWAIRLDARDAFSFNIRGYVYYDKGDTDRAIVNFSESIRLDPRFSYAFTNRCDAYLRKREYDRAISDCDEAVRLDARNANALNVRGVVHRVKKNLDHALADLSQSIKMTPKLPYPYNNRGNTFRDKGDLDAARADYDMAIRLDPAWPWSFTNRGILRAMQNDIAGARADFMAAIALSPPDANGKDAVNVARTRMAALPPIPGGQPPGANPTLVALPNLPSVVPAASSAAAADSAKPAALLPPATSGSAPGLNAVAPTAAPPAATAAPTPAFMPPTAAITPGRRAALVIGNAAYRNMSALKNPRNDAEDVAAALRSLGFATILATDLDHGGMNGALDRFSRIASEADIAIVYYSGHGMQFAGTNYLLPVDARLQGAEDVNRFRLTPIDDVLATLNTVRGARILVLDACRNNPVEADMKRRLAGAGAKGEAILARGLKPQPVGNGLLVVYATQANDVADDGTGRNSPFTSAFLRHVGTADVNVPADDVQRSGRRVSDDGEPPAARGFKFHRRRIQAEDRGQSRARSHARPGRLIGDKPGRAGLAKRTEFNQQDGTGSLHPALSGELPGRARAVAA